MTSNANTKAAKRASEKPDPTTSTPVELVDGEGYATTGGLLSLTVDQEEFHLPGVGKFLLRGLTRQEAHEVAKESDSRKSEVLIVTLGTVRPELTHAQVEQVFKSASAGKFQDLVLKINELSGIGGDQVKKAVNRF